MALIRRLILAISIIFSVLLAANMIVSTYNAKDYFAEQMQALSEDTATSLGFSMSKAAEAGDTAQMEAMVNAIFDRGYYLSIRYTRMDGAAVVSRERGIEIEGVPSWFVSLIELPAYSGTTDIMSGWMRLGVLQVVSHPGYAYRDLWRMFIEQLWLFIFVAVACYGGVGVGLQYLLRPLHKVELQADAICKKDFSLQQDIPKVPELKRVVEAMNKLSQKVSEMFQQQVEIAQNLREETATDYLSGLPSRKEFDDRLNAWIQEDNGGGPGLLLLTELSGMADFNAAYGMEAGDKLVRDIANVIRKFAESWSGALTGRRGGVSFCVFIPGVLQDEAETLLENFKAQLNELDDLMSEAASEPLGKEGETRLSIWLGAAFAENVSSVPDMLSAADTAIRSVKSSSDKEYELYVLGDRKALTRPAGEWLEHLRRVISQASLSFQYLPLYDQLGRRINQYEALARVQEGGDMLNAALFWPLVERYHLTEAMDKLALTRAVALLDQYPDVRITINISPQSVVRQGFNRWMCEQLPSGKNIAQRIILELPERALRWPKETLYGFACGAEAAGYAIALDHFGNMPAALGCLLSLPLEYVKVDRRFVANIQHDKEIQHYIKNLIRIAQSSDVKIYADGVETESQWQTMLALGVNGGQGFWFGLPSDELLNT
ncbi:EAL domain-containing protein [Teredinibacter sp. KSP-S5-2]|uniref:bifunctional diguanylate cyclase/phosphodiesterase n=1 Tax=Teredinibacter sp. KSP-S5-2 TaxID=3034506 RepID=UPI0029346B74|nr:EAL domain-containing protein [Teredinibacter sp. KSP-S5-2]WNO08557.1 EAL domain-containing protein [Teredinibacter sp. KSP-S5-2]